MDALGRGVSAVLRLSEQALLASSIEPVSRSPETVRSLLDAGEPVVAYEILCDNLYEDDIAVLSAPATEMQQAARVLMLSESRPCCDDAGTSEVPSFHPQRQIRSLGYSLTGSDSTQFRGPDADGHAAHEHGMVTRSVPVADRHATPLLNSVRQTRRAV